VTGFGLLGHLHELTRASGLAAEVDAGVVPAIAGALELLGDEGAVSGGARRNAGHAATFASIDPAVPPPTRRLLTDPMTSGGLLVALPAERAAGVSGPVIGRLVDGPAGTIAVRP
jgi:selenide,water dikinase